MKNSLLPFVSLLIPMRNEELFINNCLESIRLQDYPESNYEVLVYDGLSSDNSRDVVEKFFSKYPLGKLFENPKKIQAAAWNIGLNQSQGDIIGIVSAHCELNPDYISNIVETIRRTKADMVGGPTFADSKGLVPQTIAMALNSPFGVGNARFHYTKKEIEVDTVFMGACLKEVYKRIGGFDEELVRNQDDEFSYRLREHGGRIICNPAIRSRYFNQASLQGLWKQYFQYGFWKVRVLQKHPRQMSLRQFVPLGFVLALILTLVLSFVVSWGWLVLLVLLVAYLLANLAASIITASGQGFKKLLLLPLAFAIIHLSYGLGFLVGLFKFWNRWGDKQGCVPPLNWQA